MINATFRKWSDVYNGRWYSTIIDDRRIQWRPNDVLLLEGVSNVYRWSEQDQFRKALEEIAGRG